MWVTMGSGGGIVVSSAEASAGTAATSAAVTIRQSENLCMGGSQPIPQFVWSPSAGQLADAQRALAAARPPPWRGPADEAAIGAVAICFARGVSGPGAAGDPAWAAAVVMRGRRTLAEAAVTGTAGAPYEAGLLALREGPLLERAVRALDAMPDVLLVDATGRDHPRRAGLALHLGAILDLPTVGVTHRPLLAQGEWPAPEKGQTAPLQIEGEQVGAWLRRRANARPVAVHTAWRTSTKVAIEVVRQAAGTHRTPEPLRRARQLARLARAGQIRSPAAPRSARPPAGG
jgi:deoxyribonuclease V